MKNRKIKKLISRILFVIFMAALMSTFRAVFDEEKEYINSIKVLNSVKSILKDENYEQNYEQKIKEVIGYIYIPNTTIDYPLMQSGIENPDFYLNHNIYGQNNRFGTPYLAAYCDVNESDNLIVYGHNVSGGHIFGALINFKNKSYYEKHKFIYLKNVQGEVKRYEIIAVLQVNKNEFEYWKFVKAKNKDDFMVFVSDVMKKSIYKCGVTREDGNQLITLSTCDENGGDDRFVIVGMNYKK